jgi:predicted acyltransferase
MNNGNSSENRILSIDLFRGLTMFLLLGEFVNIYNYFTPEVFGEGIIAAINSQFHHHAWNGLRFWDLIQPYFMFIVGLSLPFAIKSRIKKGDSNKQMAKHTHKRALMLIVMGWALYCIDSGEITFYFQNVLVQIGGAYSIAYLVMHRTVKFQILFSICLLLFTEFLYRFFSVEGFNHAFVLNENFGSWLDVQYGGESEAGWVSFNMIPTAAHTIWGVLIGQFLMSNKTANSKLIKMIVIGTVLVTLGYLLAPITPIIKRISTSSFVIVSGGWSILTLAFLYWLVDVKKVNKGWTTFFGVISMNSIFIYLFAHVGGANLIEQILHPFTYALFFWADDFSAQVFTSAVVWASLWGICYWMYIKRLFIKI